MAVVRARSALVVMIAWSIVTPVFARPLGVRLQWGGGTPQAWSGTVEVVRESMAEAARSPDFTWKTLSMEPDSGSLVHESDGRLIVHQPHPIASDGVELLVDDWESARIVARISAANGSARVLDVAVAEVVASPVQQGIDDLGNRLTARLAPGADLWVGVVDDASGAASADAVGAVRSPGDRVRLQVEPLLATRLQGGHSVDLTMRLVSSKDVEIARESLPLSPRDDIASDGAAVPFTIFSPVLFDVTLPVADGVYRVELEAVERGTLRWSRTLASRTVEFVAIGKEPLTASSTEAVPTRWKTVYELDPGSPRLHERLRRMPGKALASVPIPAMPLPSLTRPSVPMPKLPSMPMPSVPLPSMSSMVPRLNGLLSHGHSAVVSHPLGAMLQLPPAEHGERPVWEAIALAGVNPGLPHAVEIDYPTDQEAVVAVVVLEGTDGNTESRYVGGIDVRRPGPGASPPCIVTHRFVFWPTTKYPLIVMANLSTRESATLGRVRVAVGPANLPRPVMPATPASLVAASSPMRRLFACVDSPDLAGDFGGGARHGQADGRGGLSWQAHLAGATHLAELAAAQGAAGTMVTVYAQGAALWPSQHTRSAPRWDAPIDGQGRDVLDAVARVHAQHGLTLIPAARFDAAVPALEEVLATGDEAGIATLGPTGRPLRLADGGIHYNILHPSVQQAVEAIVVDMASHVRGASAVAGVALVVPSDGWLHLPGLVCGLDDGTFARFATGIPSPPVTEGEGRFAERARLVEGPLREAWVAWRCAEVARFHARLAEAVAAVDARLSLVVVPTMPFLGRDAPGDDDPVRWAGFDPRAVRNQPGSERVVYAWPIVHAASDGIRDRAIIAAANRSATLAAASAASLRKAVVLVDDAIPVNLDETVRHASFGTGSDRDPWPARPAAAVDRGLAMAVSQIDADMVFDTSLLHGAGAAAAVRRAMQSVPTMPMERLLAVSPPLTVRTCRDGGHTWILVANPADAPVAARLRLSSPAPHVVDAVDGTVMPTTDRSAMVPLEAWGVRALLIDGAVAVEAAEADYTDEIRRDLAMRVEKLRQRRNTLESPAPLEVLDNPAFELGAAPVDGRPSSTCPGWEVVEARRGGVSLVPGAGPPDQPGRGLEFSSYTGLATMRSNPFTPPRTGRVSVAAWLRIPDPATQPPLRMAIEGVQGDREYYQFAAVGGLTGGRPLTGEWSQFVLQVDQLPNEAVESLRVRFDLLGPGRVQIDDVRVFDMAFDESQRSQITTAVSLLDHQRQAGDLGSCLVGLEGFWPTFLEAFVPDAAVAMAAPMSPANEEEPATPPERQAGGMVDRLRSWWQ